MRSALSQNGQAAGSPTLTSPKMEMDSKVCPFNLTITIFIKCQRSAHLFIRHLSLQMRRKVEQNFSHSHSRISKHIHIIYMQQKLQR